MMRKVLLFFALISFLFAGCSERQKTKPISKLQWELFGYLPKSTQLLVFVNLNEVRKTEFWTNNLIFVRNDLKSYQWFNEFEQTTGTGLVSGISHILAANTSDGTKIIGILFDINLNKIHKYFEEHFLSVQIDGKECYEIKSGKSPVFYFVNKSTLFVINNRNVLKRMIQPDFSSLKSNKKFVKVVREIEYKNQFWIVAKKGKDLIPLMKKITGFGEDLSQKSLLKSVGSISASANFSGKIQFRSSWYMNGKKSAYLLETAVRSALAMDLFIKKSYELGKILEKMTVQRNNNEVNFYLNLNKNDINILSELVKKKNMLKNL